MLAFVAQRQPLDEWIINEAWADLQQLPTSCGGSEHALPTESEGVVEFGSLDDSDADSEVAFDFEDNDATPIVTESGEAIDLTKQLDELDLKVAAVEAEADDELDQDSTPGDDPDAAGDWENRPVDHPAEEDPEPETVSVEISESQTVHDVFASNEENPFQEEFDDEEIIVDRYASLEAAVRQATTVITECDAAEHTTLQVRDEPPDQAPEVDQNYAVVRPDEDILPDAAEPETIEYVGQEERNGQPAAHDVLAATDDVCPVVDDTAESVEDEIGESEYEAEVAVQARVLRVPPEDDSDIIVVVDDIDRSGDESDGAGSRTPRREFRQLFTKLRQR
jgi:hypothetical protein